MCTAWTAVGSPLPPDALLLPHPTPLLRSSPPPSIFPRLCCSPSLRGPARVVGFCQSYGVLVGGTASHRTVPALFEGSDRDEERGVGRDQRGDHRQHSGAEDA